MTATHADNEVDTYLAAIREQLADLPPADREDLLEEVEASLRESSNTDTGTLESRLGTPVRFASELRAPGDFAEADPAQPAAPATPGLRDRITSHPRFRVVQDWYTPLAPMWWLVRAVVGAVIVRMVVPLPGLLTFLLLVAAIAVSTRVGLRSTRRHSHWIVALDVALLLALPVAAVVLGTRVSGDN
ncbi:MAG: hypothetical protein H7123_04645, partial [Thermoleophilia bacterium]|nr:hypothetical protein [Thermoleophilia bacterium]